MRTKRQILSIPFQLMDAHELEKFYYMLMEKTEPEEALPEDQKEQIGQEENADE